MNPVVHFELPYKDRQRTANFYAKTFGWQLRVMGPEMGNYMTATTTETDQSTMVPKHPGAINGGFYPKSKEGEVPSIVIAVKEIAAAMEKVRAGGGQIIYGMNPSGPDLIPDVGLFISFIDTEGNRLSLLQPLAENTTDQ